jgi:hypothetical protein
VLYREHACGGGEALDGNRSRRFAGQCWPDRVRAQERLTSVESRPRHLIRDGTVYAAGPMRGHWPSRLRNMASDLRSPNGI